MTSDSIAVGKSKVTVVCETGTSFEFECSAMVIQVDTETVDHYESFNGVRAKSKSVIVGREVSITGKMTDSHAQPIKKAVTKSSIRIVRFCKRLQE